MSNLKNRLSPVNNLLAIITEIKPEKIIEEDSDDHLILWLKVWLNANENVMHSAALDAIKQKIEVIVEKNSITDGDRESIYQELEKILQEESAQEKDV
jgi:hypothetical protein